MPPRPPVRGRLSIRVSSQPWSPAGYTDAGRRHPRRRDLVSEPRDLTLPNADQELVTVEQASEGAVGQTVEGAEGIFRWDENRFAAHDLAIVSIGGSFQRVED